MSTTIDLATADLQGGAPIAGAGATRSRNRRTVAVGAGIALAGVVVAASFVAGRAGDGASSTRAADARVAPTSVHSPYAGMTPDAASRWAATGARPVAPSADFRGMSPDAVSRWVE